MSFDPEMDYQQVLYIRKGSNFCVEILVHTPFGVATIRMPLFEVTRMSECLAQMVAEQTKAMDDSLREMSAPE